MSLDRQVVRLIHLSSTIGGIEVIIKKLIENIRDYSFSSFIIRNSSQCEIDIYDGITTPVSKGSNNNCMALIKLIIYARKNKDDIFHVFNIGPLFLLALRIAGVKKLVYSIHGTIYWNSNKQKKVFKTIWKWAIRKEYLFTCNSNFSGMVFKRDVYQVEDIQLLYNPFDLRQFIPKTDKKRAAVPREIVYVGRLASGKNLVKWIDVADLLKTHFDSVIFNIFGHGPEENLLKSYIRSKHLENRIFLKGQVDAPEKIYREADVLLFLSKYESFGNVIVESILCGTPVIAGAIPAMREIFKDFPEFLVEMDENLGKNVLQKLKDLEKLNRLALSAREQFIERFGDELHYKKLRAIYASI